MSKRYLVIFGLSAALVVCSAVFMNIVFDPAGIYRASSNSSKEYVNKLIISPHGLFFNSDFLNERLVKLELAQSIDGADCVVIGSSHVMQVSSFRKKRALGETCENIINLAVSAALLEDHVALSFTVASASRKPKKIIFGMDPWVFHIGKGVAWRNAYPDRYMAALQELEWADTYAADSAGGGKLANLLSLEYTARSINKAISLATHGAVSIKEVPSFDEDIGLVKPVLLPDGSLIYSAKMLSNPKDPIPLMGQGYLTEGTYYDLRAVDLYRRHMLSLINKGITPVFLLTPYHPNAWADKKSRNTLTMQSVEPVVRELARQLGVNVLGSYDPDVIGCNQNEFMDFMHATPDCLVRINHRKLK